MHRVTAGESHGPAVLVIVTDVPFGVPISQETFDRDLKRRQVGYGRGGRMAIEKDVARVLSGIRFGRTLGVPVAVLVENRDWENWSEAMAAFGTRGDTARVTCPRPGHADLSGCLKTGTDDVRDVLERASARETVARVAAGAVARALLAEVGVVVRSWVERIGDVTAGPFRPDEVDAALVEASDVRCPDEGAAARMRSAIDSAREAGESLGGVFVVVAEGVIPGLGGYAEAPLRLDATIAGALASIPAVKGVEFGDGFNLASRPGSAAHDEIVRSPTGALRRSTNRAGGLEGGMTNGEPLLVRAAMKPIPTLMRPLKTIDLADGAVVDASRERSDVCAVPAAAVVAEAEVCLALASAYQDLLGRSCLTDMTRALQAYRARISW